MGVIGETLRVDDSGVIVTREAQVKRYLNVGRKLLLEQSEEIFVRNLGKGHWSLRDVPKGH